MKQEIIKEIEALVVQHVEQYENDWYIHDKPKVETLKDADRFLFMCRDTGADVVILSGDNVCMSNLIRGEAIVGQGMEDHYFYYDGESLNKIAVEKAVELVSDAQKKLPKEYIQENKEIWNNRFDNPRPELYLGAWKKEQKLKKEASAGR